MEGAAPTFADLGVPPALVAALARQDIVTPTPIQVVAVPRLAAGEDAYLNAATGTGKTLAYLLPVFARLDAGLAATQAVILAPTHELAIQIQRQCTDLARDAGVPLRCLLLIGGTPVDRQVDKLKKKPHLVVGSPGRIRDLVGAGKLKMRDVRSIVIDEADRLVGDESLPAVRAIVHAAPAERQLVFASATADARSAAAIATFAPAIAMLRVGATRVADTIEHAYLVCAERDKPDVLRKLLHALAPERAIVFADRTDTAGIVAAKLAHHRIPAADLSAARDKLDRKRAMDAFRRGDVRVLLTSDLAARGLDLPGVSHVFNLDVPAQSKAYLHRVGRTGRAGAAGQAVTLVTPGEVRLVRRYRNQLAIVLTRIEVRGGRVDALEVLDGSD